MTTRVRAVIRSRETREVVGAGDTYEAAREAATSDVPEGWEVIAFHVVRDA